MTERTIAPTARYPRFHYSLLSPRHWPTWLLLGLLWVVGRCPRVLRFALGGALGHLAMATNAKRRQIAKTNLEWCFPEQGTATQEQWLTRFAKWLGRSYLELGFVWWSRKKRVLGAVEFEGLEALQQLMAQGRPVIAVVPHSLSMDLGGIALSAQVPMATFANAMRNPVLDWMMASRRGRFGCIIHPRSHGIRPVIKELKAGRLLFFPCDEDPGRHRKADSEFALFFGARKATLTSPSRLARMAGAVLVPCTGFFDEARGRYRVVIGQPLPEPIGENAGADAAKISLAFEQLIRLAPTQYLWTQRLFQSRPNEHPIPYRMRGREGSGPRPKQADD